MSVILKVENISKQYRLGTVGSGTLKDDFKRSWAKLRGKEDPFLKVGAVNDKSQKSTEDYVWALRDINFEVRHGEVLGIIGKNGAGKSTLLKILSRVTAPTTGVIKSRGRIASLLEVGTGFHHELTGRENIYLNGAILGMTKAEINSKLDEIIDFSGCERYIDTPTKRYSSGMTVRLAFAVAAHLEPEILVVDEVLAVGDAEFQKKAIGKMKDISQGEGRTVLFVSHNMASIQNLCTRAILLDNGSVRADNFVDKIIQQYLQPLIEKEKNNFKKEISEEERILQGQLSIEYVELISGKGKNELPQTGKSLIFKFVMKNPRDIQTNRVKFDFRIDDQYGNRLLWFSTSTSSNSLLRNKPLRSIEFLIKKLPLNQGNYIVTTHLMVDNIVSDWSKNAFYFNVLEGFFYEQLVEVSVQQAQILTDYEISIND
ncbi:ABC transporter ATP-binding protein [Leeuwenhoekiella nanhaiensis]|uniref:ABC transporter ATP-binding protein n=1 Tax=Leeuwenhoekiella nanhaiensis TaxID=1655491 RepID=A0A2G1VPH6_9FLAO|nr:ABC transporter ATP-binding protein [Leeuwenhoekiella nanhaiensis]PHQ28662.1 ABC transporter ATP-binding protein [Leeuwenhoekiella nanhaiensis]